LQDNKSFRINDQIRAQEVRVIDEKGQMLGVMSNQAALSLAQEASLDLVEVSPNNNPPVCKIANFGKMRYEMQKKAADAKKKQKVVELKEVKLSINIGKGDFDTKIKHLAKFILNGDKVRVSIRMRGREITHMDLAKKMLEDVILLTQEYAKPESNPRLEGMQMVLNLVKK
jgi:translation initiation factor IF-3